MSAVCVFVHPLYRLILLLFFDLVIFIILIQDHSHKSKGVSTVMERTTKRCISQQRCAEMSYDFSIFVRRSHAQQGCIYMIKNTVKIVIL